MCGIVAFKGDQNKTSKVIFDGLKLLEYRGYDSCGIGVIDENKIKAFKWKGRVRTVSYTHLTLPTIRSV